ncbi:MAG TPA: FlgD immunoglobulin-like domain containing protein [bacterium]|nr:FlgD immunoglobulin-like domain containing protein [bacterium]
MRPSRTLLVAAALVLASTSSLAEVPWVGETVDDGGSNDVGQYCSLALDSHDRPHIAYHDATAQDLLYATRIDGAWVLKTVDSANFTGSHCSIAVDGQDVPHVAYYNAEAGILRYGVRTGGVWTTETVDDPVLDIVGTHTSIAVDALDQPHIGYYDLTATDPKYAMKTMTGWLIEFIETTGADAGKQMDLDLDSQGVPHAAYDSNGLLVRYATRRGGTWNVIVSLSGATDQDHISLAVDPQGIAHIAYVDEQVFSDFRYYRAGSQTPSETILAITDVKGVSLALDHRGDVWVSYQPFGFGAYLDLAKREGGTWSSEIIHDPWNRDAGRYSSIALDSQGNPHVAYYDATGGDLEYAHAAVRVDTQLAGATWPVGAERTVQWSGLGPVDVQLSADGGSTYETLASGIQTNSVVIQVPHLPTRFARVRILRSDPFSTDESDSLFTVEASISLLSLAAAPVGESGVRLSWATEPGPEDLAGYRVERAEGAEWRTVRPLTRETSFTDADGERGSRYRLFAVNGLGGEYLLGETRIGEAAAFAAWPVPYRSGDLTVSFATLGGLGGGTGAAEVSLYDTAGRRVRTVARGQYAAGTHVATWDGRDGAGSPVPAGVYFLRVDTAGNVQTRKLVVLR